MDSAKVVVVGDAQCGKTTFVQALVAAKNSNSSLREDFIAEPTIGARVEVIRHADKQAPVRDTKDFVELWDVSGSGMYKSTRYIFWDDVDGVVFVYSTLQRNSRMSLSKWLAEVLSHPPNVDSDRLTSRFVITGIEQRPLLVVGTKMDLKHDQGQASNFTGILALNKTHYDPMAKEVFVCSSQPLNNMPTVMVTVDEFLDRAVVHKNVMKYAVT